MWQLPGTEEDRMKKLQIMVVQLRKPEMRQTTKMVTDLIVDAAHEMRDYADLLLHIYINDDGLANLGSTNAGSQMITFGPREHFGAMRNAAIEKGLKAWPTVEYIAIADDDDLPGPSRFAHQAMILESSGADVTGAHRAFFYDWVNNSIRIYNGSVAYVLDGSMMFTKKAWLRRGYPAGVDNGVEHDFLQGKKLAAEDWTLARSDSKEPYTVFGYNTGNAYHVKPMTGRVWRRPTEEQDEMAMSLICRCRTE